MLTHVDTKQRLIYVKVTNRPFGLLINFGVLLNGLPLRVSATPRESIGARR